MSALNTVVAFLQVSGTSLYTLVGSRVARDKLPAGFANTEAAVLVRSQAETRAIDAAVSGDRYAIHCFGGSDKASDAEAVFLAVRDRLHAATGNTATGGVVLGELETATPRIEEDTGWPVHVGIFRVLTA